MPDDTTMTQDLDALKPEPKNVGGLNFLEKYKSDLTFLRNAEASITKNLKSSGLDDPDINKKLDKLHKAIETLEKLIKEFQDEYGLT